MADDNDNVTPIDPEAAEEAAVREDVRRRANMLFDDPEMVARIGRATQEAINGGLDLSRLMPPTPFYVHVDSVARSIQTLLDVAAHPKADDIVRVYCLTAAHRIVEEETKEDPEPPELP